MKDEKQLEAYIREELRRLPPVQAPPALLAEVLARVERESGRVWWQRSWWDWPKRARVGSALFFGTISLLLCLLPWMAASYATGVRESIGGWLAPVVHAGEGLLMILQAGLGLLRSLSANPWVWGAAAVVLTSYLYLISLGSLLCRVLARPAGSRLGRRVLS